jgi:hypothetical protein
VNGGTGASPNVVIYASYESEGENIICPCADGVVEHGSVGSERENAPGKSKVIVIDVIDYTCFFSAVNFETRSY